jgi:hypothetical protein
MFALLRRDKRKGINHGFTRMDTDFKGNTDPNCANGREWHRGVMMEV